MLFDAAGKKWEAYFFFLESQVETSGHSLFFALRKSASDIVTMGLIRSSADSDTPEIVIPGDQESVFERLSRYVMKPDNCFSGTFLDIWQFFNMFG